MRMKDKGDNEKRAIIIIKLVKRKYQQNTKINRRKLLERFESLN